MKGLIYKVTNLINGKIYFGLTTRTLIKRKNQHIRESNNPNSRGYNFILHRAIRKYSIKNFKWEECENNITDLQYLKEREAVNIEKFNTYMPNGYNMTLGGDSSGMFGKKHTEQTKEKMRKIRKGYVHSEETKQKMSQSHVGIRPSKEIRKKLSLWQIGRRLPKIEKKCEICSKKFKAFKTAKYCSLGCKNISRRKKVC